ncbi:hypothetical protein OS493_007088 [Desmophyllum pertusum]|uniref:Uncharacterized protein n=1 Tax=Desmophyllum pertusum TaxID=174260 RepID=A0A9W9ZFD4_9CNID|nr:hypothetical protein OS493_007088 [Desmophyllum pertusum]
MDVHGLLVFTVSLILCLACFCLLVRAYRRKPQYRGKQKELQRPFMKRKRDTLSPRTSLLFANRQFTNGFIITPGSSPKRHHQSLRSAPLNNSNIHDKSFGNRTWPERNFLGDVITSINQLQNKKFREPKMSEGSPEKKFEPRVLFRSHPSVRGKEGQLCGCDCEEDDAATVCILFHRDEGNSSGKQDLHDTSVAQITTGRHPATDPKPELKAGASYLSEYVASESEKQLSPMSTAEEKPKTPQLVWHQPRSRRAQVSLEQQPFLWAHGCNSSKIEEKAWSDESCRKTMSVNSEAADKFAEKELKSENSHCNNGKSNTSVDAVEKTKHTYSSSDNVSSKSECNPLDNTCSDSLDNILAKRPRARSHRKKVIKSSEEEADICTHQAADTNDVVANASKTEVHCMLCGITLSKPQCFYSLGSLCTDGEICETDSDDINRHPVGDIDIDPPLVESQSHHDTGYTSSDDFDNESNLSKELDSVWLHDRRETDSYDGDYESDNEDIGVKPVVMSDDMALKPLASVGEPLAIKDYALREWKSDTPTSQAMKKVYSLKICTVYSIQCIEYGVPTI